MFRVHTAEEHVPHHLCSPELRLFIVINTIVALLSSSMLFVGVSDRDQRACGGTLTVHVYHGKHFVMS